MSTKKKQLQIFMNREDEKNFSLCLTKNFSNVLFLDGNVWSEEPIMADTIDKCKSYYCYIWNKAIIPNIPTMKRKDGKLQGPISNVVIQYERCIIENSDNLLSGRIAIGYDTSDGEFSNFVKGVWNQIKKVTKAGVFRVPEYGDIDRTKIIKEFTVGEAVIRELKSENIKRLKHRSTQNYFFPVTGL